MKNRNWTVAGLGAVALIGGVCLAVIYQGAAVATGAELSTMLPFAAGLILALVGVVMVFSGLAPAHKKTSVHTMAMGALFAALCYVGFQYFRIDIPVGDSSTAFHLGNVFCVLAALLLGGVWGGMAGSVGMTIADLMIPVYVISAPKTFLLKLGIGLITGLVAHGVFKLSRDKERKIPLVWATALSCTAGMAFNAIADPVVGYFYKMYILGVPQSAAQVWMNFNFLTTGVNAVVAIVVSTVLYLALRPALKRANLLPQV